MQIEIHPEPSEEERAALDQVLAAIATKRSGAAPWWSQGIWENVTEESGVSEPIGPDVGEPIGPDRSGPYMPDRFDL